ncbi:MAG: retropepsin-like aspartic protease [Gammaproteobacteria bacterium]|nr:retropepsin-like aspartic protease [Gammaproteobacteria bacterium]
MYAAGYLRDATEFYHEVLKQEPGRVDIQVRLGRLALLSNHPRRAIDYFTSVLNNGLRSRGNWELLADAYLQNNEPGQAALCYERAGRPGLAGTLAVMANLEVCQVSGCDDSVELGWLSNSNLPLIRAEANGKRLNLLVDTAASDLVLDENVAIDAGIPHGGSETRFFAGGLSSSVTYGYMEALQLGDLLVSHILTQHLDLQTVLAAYSATLPIHGILGLSVLSRFKTMLDYRQGCLRLSTGSAIENTLSSGVESNSFPMWIADHQFILVQAQMQNAETGLWAIDTGMNGVAFAVSADTAMSVGLQGQGGEQEAGIGGGGAVKGQRVMLPSLKLGEFERKNSEGMLLHSLPLQSHLELRMFGMLAGDFLQDARLSMDFSTMQMTLD